MLKMMGRVFIVFILNFGSVCAGMQIHEYLTRYFSQYVYDTDFIASALLKEKPLPFDVNCIIVPWAILIRDNKLDMVPKVHFNGGFTICQHLGYEKIIPTLKKMGIDVLFTPSADKYKKYEGITVLPFPLNPVNGADPKKNKDLLYSFIGANPQVPIRNVIFSLRHPKNSVVKKRKAWQFYLSEKEQRNNAAEYKDVLSRSRYSLCPRGIGPSSIRFWESLQAGAIPVLFDDDIWLPAHFDWEACVVRIDPKNIHNLANILKKIPKAEEDKKRIASIRAYKHFCGENLVRVVWDYYSDKYGLDGLKEKCGKNV